MNVEHKAVTLRVITPAAELTDIQRRCLADLKDMREDILAQPNLRTFHWGLSWKDPDGNSASRTGFKIGPDGSYQELVGARFASILIGDLAGSVESC